MDHFTRAANRYDNIKKPSFPVLSDSAFSDLWIWLEKDINPLLTDFTRLPRFRELAAWSRTHLILSSDAPERHLVDAVDRGLVHSATLLSSIVEHTQYQSAIESFCEGQRPVPETEITMTCEIDGSPTEMSPHQEATAIPFWKDARHELRMLISRVREIAGRDWNDLVDGEDYFATRQEMIEIFDGSPIQNGHFVSALNSRIHPMCDLVAQSLRHRIDERHAAISKLFNRFQQIANKKLPSDFSFTKDTAESVAALDDAIRELDAVVFASTESTLRTACVVLTHVYSALHPNPDLDWLDIDNQLVEEHRSRFKSIVRGRHGADAMDAIAVAIRQMSTLNYGVDPRTQQVQAAIAAGKLVLDKTHLRAWWDNRELLFPRRGREWELLVRLVENARIGRDTDYRDIYRDRIPSQSALPTLCSRLMRKLPNELSQRVVRGDSKGSFRLSVPRDKICVIS